MQIIETHKLVSPSSGSETQQIYNGLDCCVTFEVWEALQTLFNTPPEIYGFERALQAPALEMMLRGFRIDKFERDRVVTELRAKLERLDFILQTYAKAIWDKPINPRSVDQLKAFFYEKMKIPEIWTSIKGERKLRMNRETLEKLENYFHAKPIIACILAIREIAGKIKVLTTDIDSDGRFRTSINIGGTETGRFSSSKFTTGTGGNLFNITEELRRPFVADPGWKLCGIDLEQAESREVGWICGRLFGDWSYLDACEAGDLHTTVAKMVWPNLQWTGDPSKDKDLAERPYYRHHSYRYMAKRFGHSSNYLISAWTASRQVKCPQKLCEDFQIRYYASFPLPKWHQWVAEQLQVSQCLTTSFGRQRHFFGRPNDDTTLREAVAFEPQSCTADRLNIGLLRMWKHFGNRIQILLQLYDAIYFQFREDDNEAELINEALQLIDIPLEHNGRKFTVPGEAKTGWNWSKYVGPADVERDGKNSAELNLDGLKKFKGYDNRKRTPLIERAL